MKKIYALLTLAALTYYQPTHAETRKILFLGNSYTAVNDLPTTLKNIALAYNDTLITDSNTPGGMTLQGHTTDATTLAKIQQGGWDYVVIQAQSQEPSFDPVQVATDTYPYAHILDSLIHAASPCAETIFYMTWGRKNGDASNCAAYPPICTYEGMQQRLRESYLEMSLNNNATCAPAGVAWRTVRNTFPGIELYNADESHPTISGTYLVACTFYASLFHRSVEGCTFITSGVLASDAANLQLVASHTVLDSIENWQHNGAIPNAKFTHTNNQNQFTFSNQSVRSNQYEWDFGDGTAISTQTNPSHSYNTVGNYIVTLKAINNCGLIERFKDTVHVTSIVNGIDDLASTSQIRFHQQGQTLLVENLQDGMQLCIYDAKGSLVSVINAMSGTQPVSIQHLNCGLYYLSIKNKSQVLLQGKFEKQ